MPARAARNGPQRRASRGAMKPAANTTSTVAAKNSPSASGEKPKPVIRMAGAMAKNAYSAPMTRPTASAGAMKRRSRSSCR
ncbi:hypothetical protein D3C85_1483320 [compost metagenome]